MKVGQTDSRTSQWLARLCACLIFVSVALGQSGLTKTLREAEGGGHVNGYYNKTDSQYSNGGLQVQLAGLTAEVSHKVEFSKNNGSTWSGANQLWFKGGLVTNAIISTDVAENAVNFDIYHSQLTAAPYSMSNGETIQIRVINDVFTVKDTFVCTITGGGNDLTYDITPPTISSVSSGTGNGTYGISANINITVTFSEPTTLSNGSLRVTLNTGQNVDIAAATYSNTASGTYQVQEGDLVGDLNNTGVSITGISLADAAGNEVENYTPGSNLGATSDIVIDGVRPTITSVTSSTANGTYGIGSNINITVTFSEATTVAGGDLRVTLDVVQNVDITGATYNTTASGTYTIQEGDASVDLTTTNISITAGTIEDAVGNALTNYTPASNLATTSALVIDGIRPTIASVNSSSASTTYGIGDNIPIIVYFSEDVTLASGNLLVELETGAVDRQAIITPFASTSSGTGTYTVQIDDVSPDLMENSVSLSGGTLRDVAGNDLTNYTVPGAENLNDNKEIVIDGVRPTISTVTSLSPDDNYKISDNILVQVTFSEEVSLSGGNLEVTLETGATDQKATISSIVASETATGTYNVQDGDESTDLTATVVGLSAGTLEDAGGNNITDFTIPPGQNIADLKAIVVDGVRPTIDYITSTTGDGTYNIDDEVNIRLIFTEAVTTSGGGSIVVTLETGTPDRQVTISNVVSSLNADGTYTVQDGDESTDLNVNSVVMSAGSLVDDFGNPVTDFSIPGGWNLADAKALVIDGVRPTVTNVSASTLNGAYKAGNDIDITVQFSDAVDVLGSPTLNLDVGGGYLISNPAGTGTNTLTFTYTIQATHNSGDLDYVNTASLLPGTSIKDAAGNDATLTLYAPGAGVPGAGSLGVNKALIIDTTSPTVTDVTSSAGNGAYKALDIIPVTVTFSEVVTVSGSPTLKLETGTTDRNATYTGVSGSTLSFEYIVQPGDETNDLDYWDANSLTAGTYIRDAASNDATLTLAIPGDPNSLGDNKALVIDTTPPTVSSVSSTAGDGDYVETDLIPITITFSEAVYVAIATPTLTLETGTVDALVNYVNGSDGDAELLFNYTVAAGHESDNLDYTATDALQLNLATIQDAAGNDAVLTLVAPGASGSLGFSKDRDVDAVIPTVTCVTSNKADGVYKAGVVIPISVVFSEAVAVAGGVPTLTLNVGGGYAVNYTSVSGDTLVFEYTVLAGQNQVDLDYLSAAALSAGISTIRDVAGNDAVLTLASPGSANSLGGSKNIDVDTTPPTVSNVTSTTSNAAYKAGQSINVRVTFSEVVIDAGSPYVILETGTTDRNATYVSGKGTNTLVFSYTVVAGDGSNDLDYVSAGSLVAGTALQDSAGNQVSATPLAVPGAAGSLGANKAIIVDTQAPTVLNVTSSKTDGYYKAGETIPISVIFSEAVTVSGTPTLTLETGATDRDATYSSGSGSDTLTFSYTVQPGDGSSDLDYVDANSLSAGTSIQDAAGNDATLTLAAPGESNSLGDNKALVIDTTPPTVSSVSSTAGDGYYVAGDTISITVTFTETVYKAGAGTLTLALETGSTDAVLDYASGSGTGTLTFIYIVALGHESDNLDYIDANALQLNLITIRDTTGNDADLALPTPGTSGSLGYGNDRNIDAIIPTVTAVTSTKADGAYKAAQVIPIAVVFSEAVAVTGTPQLTLNVGSGYVVDFSSISSDTVVFNYTIQAGQNKVNLGYQSTTALSLSGGTIQDAAGNDADTTLAAPGGASSLSGAKNLDVDTTPPAFSSVAPADSSYQNTTKVSYTLSEDIASGSITWGRTGGTADPAEPHSQALTGSELSTGAHADITLTNDPSLVSGTVYNLTFAGQDAAGNAATNIVRTDVTFDDTPPQAALTYSDTLASQGDTVTITVTLSEAALDTPGITIEYTSITLPSDATMTATADSLVWTYDALIPSGNDGTATVTIGMDDLAGNALTTANTTGRTDLMVDNTPPGYVLAYSDSLAKEGDIVTITATFEESVKSAPATKPTIAIDFADSDSDTSGAAMSMGPADTLWIYALDIPSKNDGFATVTVSATDAAGIPAVPVSGSTNTLKVDNTPPTITPTSPVDNGFVRTTAVTYTLGETVDSGQVTWTLEGGAADGNSPHIKALTGTELIAGTHTGVLTNAPTLVQAAEYTIQFIAVDYAGNPDTTFVSTVTYDTLAPTIGSVVVYDGPAADIDSTSSTDSLTAHWGGFSDPVAGIALYEYAVGSTRGDTDIVSWTGVGTDTLVTAGSLSLVHKRRYYISVRATDGAGNVSDSVSTDGVRIVDRPRLTVSVVQNSVISEYVQILVNDTLAMADSIRIDIDNVLVSVTEIDTFAYIGTHKLAGDSTYSLVVTGFSGWANDTSTSSLAMALAKQGQPWVAASVDQRFKTAGSPGSVSGDRYLLVVDSTLMGLSAVHGGAYRLGDGQFTFDQPVRVSMHRGMSEGGQEEAQAIYVLRSNGRWEELSSVDEGELVITWTNRAGTFRLGRRTIIVPQITSLHQNYPNPFNPTTRIVFDLGFQDGPRQHARVVIYNLLGREVLTLYDGETSTGRYELTWQGMDARGLAVASGVYFVRLSTSTGHQMTKKMLLVR